MRRILAAAIGLTLFSCSSASEPETPPYEYQVPADLGDGLSVAHATSVGVNVDSLESLIDAIRRGKYAYIHGVLILKGGSLVLEEYFSGRRVIDGDYKEFDHTTLHDLQSVTKSVVSILVGQAIEDGLIPDTQEPVASYFPEHSDLLGSGPKADLRIEHLLNMSGGLAWQEYGLLYESPGNDARHMNESADPIRYVLGLPSEGTPGEAFVYSSGLTVVLGEIVTRAVGTPIDEYAQERLFAPLGIEPYIWGAFSNGVVHAGGALLLRHRDMLKLGYLYLNDGAWQGEQLVPKSWVERSTQQQAPDFAYGYLWWLDTYHVGGEPVRGYSGRGYGGQFITVVPELELVAVMTGAHVKYSWQPLDMLRECILPAITQP